MSINRSAGAVGGYVDPLDEQIVPKSNGLATWALVVAITSFLTPPGEFFALGLALAALRRSRTLQGDGALKSALALVIACGSIAMGLAFAFGALGR